MLNKLRAHMSEVLGADRDVTVPDLPGSALAMLILSLAEGGTAPVVVITDGTQSTEALHRDLLTLTAALPGEDAVDLYYFPARETRSADNVEDPALTGHRLNVLLSLLARSEEGNESKPNGCVIVSCIQALLQKTAPHAHIDRNSLILAVGDEIEMEDMTSHLERSGYAFKPEVEEEGDAAVKGGIVDVWPPTCLWPLRFDLFGPEIESIRSFDPADQKSRQKMDNACVAPAVELPTGADEPLADLLSYLQGDASFVWIDEGSIEDHAEMHEHFVSESGTGRVHVDFDGLCADIAGKPGGRRIVVSPIHTRTSADRCPDITPISGVHVRLLKSLVRKLLLTLFLCVVLLSLPQG